MTTKPSPEELQRLFDENGIGRRHLYPWWYHVHRWLGARPDPPILYSLPQHFAREGLTSAVILLGGAAILHWRYGTDVLPLWPVLSIAVVIPVWSWLSYRRIRRRIGLEPPS